MHRDSVRFALSSPSTTFTGLMSPITDFAVTDSATTGFVMTRMLQNTLELAG